jgi:hypothetical protein
MTSDKKSARDVLLEVAPDTAGGPAETPLIDWSEGVATVGLRDSEDLAERLKKAEGEVVCHFETESMSQWLRYLPDRDRFDWHVVDHDGDGSFDHLEEYRGMVTSRLQNPIKEDAELTLHRPENVPIEFEDPDRDVEYQSEPKELQEYDQMDDDDDVRRHPGTDDPRFPEDHDKYSDLA